MTITRGRFYFGTAGDLQVLPLTARVSSGVDVSPARFGYVARALAGRPTVVNYGFRRTWPLQWPYLRYDDSTLRTIQRVEAVYRGDVTKRAYLLDTRQTNALPPDIAATGAEGSTDNFENSTGSLAVAMSGPLHTDLLGLTDAAMTWGGLATGSGRTCAGIPHSPVLAGSNYLLSGYVKTAGSGSVALTLFFYDSSRTFISSLQGSTITLNSTATRYAASFASGSVPGTAASFKVGFTTVSTTTDLVFGGLQLEYDAAGGSTPAAWCLGKGGAEVVVGSYTEAYPDAPGRMLGATFLEV